MHNAQQQDSQPEMGSSSAKSDERGGGGGQEFGARKPFHVYIIFFMFPLGLSPPILGRKLAEKLGVWSTCPGEGRGTKGREA